MYLSQVFTGVYGGQLGDTWASLLPSKVSPQPIPGMSCPTSCGRQAASSKGLRGPLTYRPSHTQNPHPNPDRSRHRRPPSVGHRMASSLPTWGPEPHLKCHHCQGWTHIQGEKSKKGMAGYQVVAGGERVCGAQGEETRTEGELAPRSGQGDTCLHEDVCAGAASLAHPPCSLFLSRPLSQAQHHF